MTPSAKLRRHAPSPADQYAILADSVVLAADNTFFSYAERVEAPPDQDDRTWVGAVVHFHGAFAGSLELIVPDAVARDLYCALAGADPVDALPREQTFDALGEFANIVCGDWLTRTCERRRFDLRPPDVRVLTPSDRHVWWAEESDWQVLEMRINDEPLRLRLVMVDEG